MGKKHEKSKVFGKRDGKNQGIFEGFSIVNYFLDVFLKIFKDGFGGRQARVLMIKLKEERIIQSGT